MRRRLPAARTLLVVVAAVWGMAGCADCAVDSDCNDSFACSEGACVAVNALTVVDQRRNDDGTWRVTLDARFAGTIGTVLVTRSSTDGGDACVPFVARRIGIDKAEAGIDTVTVVVDDLPALGASFTLQFTLLSTPTASAFATLTGEVADDVGGFTLVAPDEGDVDVVDTPTIEVVVEGSTEASVIVRPATGTALPRAALTTRAGTTRRQVLLARGEQIVEVEAVVGGTVRRCARSYRGVGDADTGVELLLLAEPAGTATGVADDDTVWLELVARARGDTTTSCDSTTAGGNCTSAPTPATPSSRNIHQLRLAPAPLIDVGVVPVTSSGPVDALVRVTVDGAHLGVLGPMTLAPSAGESWRAGQLVFADDDGTLITSSSPPIVGQPW